MRRTGTLAMLTTLAVGTLAAAPSSPTQVIVDATSAFLDTLTTEQRAKVQFPFDRPAAATAAKFPRTGGRGPAGFAFVGERYGRAVWSNYPVSDVPRPGLRLGNLNASQRTAATKLLQVLLSPKGYQKVDQIMGADQVLHDDGEPFDSGRDVYTIGIFGTPSATDPWMIQFGGHHLGINVTLAGGHGVVAPTMTGAQPAQYHGADGKLVRPMGAENDKAFALMGALDAAQRKRATLDYEVGDLVRGPGHDGPAVQPEGQKGSSLDARQRELLMDVVAEWVGIVNERYADERLAEIRAGLDDTYFAWSGPTTHEPDRNGSAYYRIQGPKVWIEFSPQGVGGDLTNHVHTVYRDPSNAYGSAHAGGGK